MEWKYERDVEIKVGEKHTKSYIVAWGIKRYTVWCVLLKHNWTQLYNLCILWNSVLANLP